MFAAYLFLRFKDGGEIHLINPLQTLMNLQYHMYYADLVCYFVSFNMIFGHVHIVERIYIGIHRRRTNGVNTYKLTIFAELYTINWG